VSDEWQDKGKEKEVPVDRHGQIAQVDSELVVPLVPSPLELVTLLLLRAQAIDRTLSLDEQRTILAQVRELQHDVRRPEPRRPHGDRGVVYGHGSAGQQR